jgi:hypothetical protein
MDSRRGRLCCLTIRKIANIGLGVLWDLTVIFLCLPQEGKHLPNRRHSFAACNTVSHVVVQNRCNRIRLRRTYSTRFFNYHLARVVHDEHVTWLWSLDILRDAAAFLTSSRPGVWHPNVPISYAPLFPDSYRLALLLRCYCYSFQPKPAVFVFLNSLVFDVGVIMLLQRPTSHKSDSLVIIMSTPLRMPQVLMDSDPSCML